MDSEKFWYLIYVPLIAYVVFSLFGHAYGQEIDANTFQNMTQLNQSSTDKVVQNGIKLGIASKNLIMVLHDADLSFSEWIFSVAHVNVPAFVITLLGIAFLGLTIGTIFWFILKSFKGVAIITAVIVAIIMLLPIIPIGNH